MWIGSLPLCLRVCVCVCVTVGSSGWMLVGCLRVRVGVCLSSLFLCLMTFPMVKWFMETGLNDLGIYVVIGLFTELLHCVYAFGSR
jgi:hypothetical protein